MNPSYFSTTFPIAQILRSHQPIFSLFSWSSRSFYIFSIAFPLFFIQKMLWIAKCLSYNLRVYTLEVLSYCPHEINRSQLDLILPFLHIYIFLKIHQYLLSLFFYKFVDNIDKQLEMRFNWNLIQLNLFHHIFFSFQDPLIYHMPI